MELRLIGARSLPVHGRPHNEPVHRLDVPTRAHKLGSEPVQQLLIGRGRAHAAEVAGRIHKTRAEVVLPNPVDHDASSQRMIRLGEPVRQGEPSPTGLHGIGGRRRAIGRQFRAQHRQHAGRNQRTGRRWIAPKQNPRRRRLGAKIEDELLRRIAVREGDVHHCFFGTIEVEVIESKGVF